MDGGETSFYVRYSAGNLVSGQTTGQPGIPVYCISKAEYPISGRIFGWESGLQCQILDFARQPVLQFVSFFYFNISVLNYLLTDTQTDKQIDPETYTQTGRGKLADRQMTV